MFYVDVVEMDPAQVGLLFTKYLQWLAAFIDEFLILTKRR